MERRAASHTEEEEMNQRRKLLNAARRGDTKAISKLFELYQVRILSGEQLAKLNRTSTYHAPVEPAKGGKPTISGSSKKAKAAMAKPVKAKSKQWAKVAAKSSNRKPSRAGAAKKHKAKHE